MADKKPSAWRVAVPVAFVAVGTANGTEHKLMENGSELPANVSPETIKHLSEIGFIEPVSE